MPERLALLQGLLDTSGWVGRFPAPSPAPAGTPAATPSGKPGGPPSRSSVVRFGTSSPRLARDVAELARSLGARVTSSVEPAAPRTAASACARMGARHRFEVLEIRLPLGVDPFRLSPNADLYGPSANPTRKVVSVTPAGSKPCQCVLVDSDDHLYVTGGFTLTHNTFLCQTLAYQTAMAGLRTIFINPKGFDSLAGLSVMAGGKTVKLTEVEEQGGFFDPFRFTKDPNIAADIAIRHILDVLGARGVAGQGFTQEQEIALSAGLREGAKRGARCVAEALGAVADPAVRDLVLAQAADPLFRLGIGMRPQPPYHDDRRLLLVEFDRALDLPESGVTPAEYTRTQRLALAAIRLVTRTCMELLANGGGGVLIVDEAWTFLQSSEGLAQLQSLGRLGRSQNVLPVFATQRVDDLLRQGVDMESYLSRVFVMKLTDEREQRAALKLCRLEATPGRLDWLRDCGPRQASEDGRPARPAFGLHRDLQDRHGAVMVGPFPDEYSQAISTNPLDKARRAAEESSRGNWA